MSHQYRTYRWAELFGMNGHEIVHIGAFEDEGFLAYGEIYITDNHYVPETSVRYAILFDTDFIVQLAAVTHLSTRETKILVLKESGKWEDGSENEIPEFAGCKEIDIAGSSFTKSPPIHRLGLYENGRVRINVISAGYSKDELYLGVDAQQYTCLELRRPELPDGSSFRFENLSAGYTEKFFTDGDGVMFCFADEFGDHLVPRRYY